MPVDAIDEHFTREVRALPDPGRGLPDVPEIRAGQLVALFRAQAQSRHLDFAARWLEARGDGFYTIGSAGHESNAALGLLSAPTDPALLHYRSGGFYAARAAGNPAVDPVRDVLRSLTASAADPMSGGRHKVVGHPALHIVPQTSTIASHLPRAVGLGFALGLARRQGRPTPWPDDAVVVCSVGDASLNHSTAAGALNAAAYVHRLGLACPVLVVCEDNGIGISTPTPSGWPETVLGSLPGVPCHAAEGSDPEALLDVAAAALDDVRAAAGPAVLHLRTVRLMGHAGSDVEIAYRSRGAIEADYARDPLLGTARRWSGTASARRDDVLADYEAARARLMAPPRRSGTSRASPRGPRSWHRWPSPEPAAARRRPVAGVPGEDALTLAQAINRTLADALADHDDVLVLGQDVGRKGGVYGVTRGLHKRFGSAARPRHAARRADHPRHGARGEPGGLPPRPGDPVPRLPAQRRGPAARRGGVARASSRTASTATAMVVRVAGLRLPARLRRALPQRQLGRRAARHPGDRRRGAQPPGRRAGDAPDLPRPGPRDGRVCVVVEPIARYHARDLVEGDGLWTAGYSADPVPLGEVGLYGEPGTADLLIATYGNGVHLSLRAAAALEQHGITTSVLDLRWLTPLPLASLAAVSEQARRVLVVDEGRASGGVGESVVAALVDAGCAAPLARVASADSYVPLGPAAGLVLLSEDDIVTAARRLVAR